MCIIVAKKKGLELPTKEILRNCFNYNSDGAGLMFNDGNITWYLSIIFNIWILIAFTLD